MPGTEVPSKKASYINKSKCLKELTFPDFQNYKPVIALQYFLSAKQGIC